MNDAPPGHHGTYHQAHRLAPGDATPLNSHSAGRRTSTPSAATDNLRPRRPLGPRRASSPGRGQPTPPPPSPPLSRPPASSSFYISDPISPRAANTGRRCPSAAAAAKSTTPTLPSAAASSATNTTSSAAAAAAPPVSAPPSSTLTTAYPATDNPGPDRVNRESVISILDDPFFLRYDYDPSSDAESPFSHLPSPPRAAADHQPGGDENGASPRWPPPRRESLTISPSPFLVRTLSEISLSAVGCGLPCDTACNVHIGQPCREHAVCAGALPMRRTAHRPLAGYQSPARATVTVAPVCSFAIPVYFVQDN